MIYSKTIVKPDKVIRALTPRSSWWGYQPTWNEETKTSTGRSLTSIINVIFNFTEKNKNLESGLPIIRHKLFKNGRFLKHNTQTHYYSVVFEVLHNIFETRCYSVSHIDECYRMKT